MACALTQGYNYDCRNGMAGIKEVYIMEHANATGVTLSPGKVVTAITKASGKRFWKYQVAKNTAEFSETEGGSEENGTSYFDQEGTLVIPKMETSIRNEIMNLVQTKCLIVAVDRNNRNWLYGYEMGMMTSGTKAGTGKAAADLNGYTIPLKGQERELAFEVDDTTLATLETPGP